MKKDDLADITPFLLDYLNSLLFICLALAGSLQFRCPGMKMKVMFGPRFVKESISPKADKLDVQKLQKKINLIIFPLRTC